MKHETNLTLKLKKTAAFPPTQMNNCLINRFYVALRWFNDRSRGDDDKMWREQKSGTRGTAK